MMRIKSSGLLALAVAGAFSAAGSAHATNGANMIGYGAGSIGMGGVGITSPQDSMCAGANPACLGEFVGPQFDIGAGLFDPRRRSATTLLQTGNSWSGVNTYIMPSMGFVFPFNDVLTIGFAALPAGGGGSTFDPNFFNPTATSGYLGVELLQLIIPITATFKLDQTHTVGFSAVPARQRFLAQGLGSVFDPFTTDTDHYTNKGHDYSNGLGFKLGWTGKYLGDKVTLGAAWSSTVHMSKFKKYKGLFPDGGSLDMPENLGIGIGIKPTEQLTVALDVVKTYYSDVPGFGNQGPDDVSINIGTCDRTTGICTGKPAMGAPGGPGFTWNDQTVYKLGVAYKNVFPSWFGEDKLTLRAGYNYGKAPINDKYLLFSLLAPATTEKHITVGATYSMGEQSIFGFGSEGLLTVAYMHAVKKTISGPTTGPSGSGLAEMEMYQNSLDIAYTLKF